MPDLENYGSSLPTAFGTADAPQLFSCITKRYSERPMATRQLFHDMLGKNVAAAQHSAVAEIDFEGEVTSDSTDFLDLRSGAAAIAFEGGPSGLTLARRAIERWRLGQRKSCAINAINLPDAVLGGGALATINLSAFTPAASLIALPGDDVIYSTVGLGHAAGEIQSLTLTQSLTVQLGKPTPAMTITHAHSFGYVGEIELEILAKSGTRPALKSTLTLTGAPEHAAGFKVETSDVVYDDLVEAMYRITAFWIPGFA
jgi:hypothetical protein